MVEACIGAGINAGGLAVVAQLQPITDGEKLGSMTAASLLGVGLLGCLAIIAKLWLTMEGKQKDYNDKQAQVIASAVAAIQASTDATKTQTGIMVEVKDHMNANAKAMEQCAEIRKAELQKLMK